MSEPSKGSFAALFAARQQQQARQEAEPPAHSPEPELAPPPATADLVEIYQPRNVETKKSTFVDFYKSTNQETKKSTNLQTKKKERKVQVNLSIKESSERALRRYAFDHELFLSEAAEAAIELLQTKKSTNLGPHHDKERARVMTSDEDDEEEIGIDHHHLARAREVYEELTGRGWRDRDRLEYRRVKDVPIAELETAMRVIHSRAQEPIGSFRYFTESYFREGKGRESGGGLRKRYQRLIEEISRNYVGSSLPPSEKIAKLKAACVREGVAWKDDLANELLGF